MKRLALLAVPLALALTGCPSPYSPQGYCEHVVELECQYWYKCCNAAERVKEGVSTMWMFFGFRNEDECKTELKKRMCPSYDIYREAVEQGRATWKDDTAKTCMAHLEKGAAECKAEEIHKTSEDGCDLRGDIMQGKVANDGVCYIDEECTDVEAVCEPKTSEDPNKPLYTAAGTCKAPPHDGQACAAGNVCADGNYCDGTTCRTLKASGVTCAGSNECQSGTCNYTSNTCDPKLANGENCYTDTQCQSGSCDNGTCGPGTTTTDNTTYDICDGNPISVFGMTFALPVSQP